MPTKQELIDFGNRIARAFENKEIRFPIHLSGGNEEQLIEIFKEVRPQDYVVSTHRAHYHYLLKGGSMPELERKIRMGESMRIVDKNLNFYATSIVAGGPAIATGLAWAIKEKGEDRKVWAFVGDGAEEEGHFYEAVRYVAGWKLPCTFVIEDNGMSVNTPSVGERNNGFKLEWPDCVRRYTYERTFPHVGSGKWVTF